MSMIGSFMRLCRVCDIGITICCLLSSSCIRTIMPFAISTRRNVKSTDTSNGLSSSGSTPSYSKHHAGVDNKTTDALSRRLCPLQALSAAVIDFECLIQYYHTCRDFGEIYASLIQDPPTLVEDFTIINGFLFRGTRLCIPNTSLQNDLI